MHKVLTTELYHDTRKVKSDKGNLDGAILDM